MNLPTLHQLYSELSSLIDKPNMKERVFQEWFEKNPEIFKILQFDKAFPHPYQVDTGENDVSIPDFLVKEFTGTWGIFELKRPDTVVISSSSNKRIKFTAEFESYISQCREYSEFFQELENRNRLNQRYEIDVQKSVPAIIVAGRDHALEKRKAFDMLYDRGSKVKLYTFDDILNAIRVAISLQETQFVGLRGLSFTSMVIVHDNGKERRQFLLSCGLEEKRNAILIGIQGIDSLFIEIYDQSGQLREVVVPFVLSFIGVEKLVSLHFEIGFHEDMLFVAVLVNGRVLLFKEFDAVQFDQTATNFRVIGSDVRGQTDASFSYCEMICYNKTLSYELRNKILKYFSEKYRYYLSPLISDLPFRIEFKGRKFLHSTGHPNFTKPDEASSSEVLAEGAATWYVAGERYKSRDGDRVPVKDPHLRATQFKPPRTI